MKMRRKWILTPALTIAILMIAAVTRKTTGADLPEGWLQDWAKAKAAAKAGHKPILAVFSAAWCRPCQYMVHEVYPKDSIKTILKDWVAVYIDEEKDPKTLEQFKIEGFPTFVFLSPDAVEEDRFSGGAGEKAFARKLKVHPDYMAKLAKLQPRIAGDPQDAQFWKDLGDVYLMKDKDDEALEAFQKAAKLDPSDKVGVADFIYFQKNLPKAEEDLPAADKALADFESKFPKSFLLPKVVFWRGLIAHDLDRKDEGTALLKEGLARFPDSAMADDMKRVLEQWSGKGEPKS